MTERTFQQLKQQFMAGDPKGMAYVFENCASYCIRTLMKKTDCSQADAEDLFMEAILTFRDNMVQNKIEHLTNLNSYMYAICWNKWSLLYRARKRWQKESKGIENTLYIMVEEHNPMIEAEERQQLLEGTQQKLQAVMATLKEMEEKCRKLLTYFYLEKRSMSDIAELMDFANANVAKVSKFRCYQRWMKKVKTFNQQLHGRTAG